MNFRVFIVIGVLGLLFSSPGYCGDKARTAKGKSKYPSYYNPGIKVDGKVADWPAKSLYCDFDAKIFYGVVNDSSHLLFCLQVLEASEQIAILRDGFIFYIDPLGKKNKNCSVCLTCGKIGIERNPPEKLPDDRKNQFQSDILIPRQGVEKQGVTSSKAQSRTEPPAMIPKQNSRNFSALINTAGFLEGFNHANLSGSGNGNDFSASIAIDSADVLVIEAMIPLDAFPSDPWLSKSLVIGFTITGGMNSPRPGGANGPPGQLGPPGNQQRPGGRGTPGGRPGGGEMNGGGGSGMGGPGGPSGEMAQQNMSETYKIWHKFSLSHNP